LSVEFDLWGVAAALSATAVAGTLEEVVLTALRLWKRCAMRVWWGAVAQLGERLVRNEEVSGSIPLSSTKESRTRQPDTWCSAFLCRLFASALPVNGKIHKICTLLGFASPTLLQVFQVAPLVEKALDK
jgi:hypothetical protein